MAFWMNGMWALWNCYFALYVVRHSLAMKQERDDHRFADQLAIEVRVEDEGSAALVPARPLPARLPLPIHSSVR